MNIQQKQDMLEACLGDSIQAGLWPPLPFDFNNLAKKRQLGMDKLYRFFKYGAVPPELSFSIGVVDNLRMRNEKIVYNFSRKTMDVIHDRWRGYEL